MSHPETPTKSIPETPLIASPMMQQLADAVTAFQLKTTGRSPLAVTVVLSEDTLFITLHGPHCHRP